HRLAYAEGLVSRLLTADIEQVPAVAAALGDHRDVTDLELQRLAADPATPPKQLLRARLALLPADPGQISPLHAALLEAEPDDFLVIRQQLEPHRDKLLVQLWRVATTGKGNAGPMLRAAGALAGYAPEDRRWKEAAG